MTGAAHTDQMARIRAARMTPEQTRAVREMCLGRLRKGDRDAAGRYAAAVDRHEIKMKLPSFVRGPCHELRCVESGAQGALRPFRARR